MSGSPGWRNFSNTRTTRAKHDVASGDVERLVYTRSRTGTFWSPRISTQAGTLLTAYAELCRTGPYELKTEAKKKVVTAVKATAQNLGNTPTVQAANHETDPAIIEAYLNGLIPTLNEWKDKTGSNSPCRYDQRSGRAEILKRAGNRRKESPPNFSLKNRPTTDTNYPTPRVAENQTTDSFVVANSATLTPTQPTPSIAMQAFCGH
jgi:hypothetical protein